MQLDRMYKFELETEIEKQNKYLSSAIRAVEKIYGTSDYSDEIAKSFHLGKVGFRKDTKRQNRSIDRAINNGLEASKQYGIRDNAKGIIVACQNTIDYIVRKSPDGDIENYSKQMILAHQKQVALSGAEEIKWEKSKGRISVLYTHGKFEIEKVDSDFVSIRQDGVMITHCKTIKEAKATVSLFIKRETQSRSHCL